MSFGPCSHKTGVWLLHDSFIFSSPSPPGVTWLHVVSSSLVQARRCRFASRKYNELEFTLTGKEEAGSSLVREFLQQPSMRDQLRQKSIAGFLDTKDVLPVFLSLKNDDHVVLTFVLFKGYAMTSISRTSQYQLRGLLGRSSVTGLTLAI